MQLVRTKKKFDAAVLGVFGELDEELNDDYVELWHIPKSFAGLPLTGE